VPLDQDSGPHDATRLTAFRYDVDGRYVVHERER